jgi:hypothetical protein
LVILRPAIAALLVSLALFGSAIGQSFPIDVPKPLGGPIVGPNGKIMTGLDQPVSPWTGGVEFGLNGNDGNVQILKIFAGADFRYDTPENLFLFNGLYIFTHHEDEVIEQKALFYMRDEIPFADILSYYGQGQLEYDEFRPVTFRLAAHNGISFTALRDSQMLLKVRAGLGTAREFNTPSREWVPEAQFGGDFEYRFTERTTLLTALDYYPDLYDFDHYRIRARVSLNFLIDPDLNLVLRIGAMERYDSQSFGYRKSDLDYFTTLMFRF